MILTPEQIAQEIDSFLKEHPDCQWDSTMAFQAIAKAQAKEILKWGDEPCYEHDAPRSIFQEWIGIHPYYKHRRECPICWQQLRKELE